MPRIRRDPPSTSIYGSNREEMLVRNVHSIIEKITGPTDEQLHQSLKVDEVRSLIINVKELFEVTLEKQQIDSRIIRQITTKFRDAGRRSPPWQPGSTRGHRRPQDGSDGNRQNRWLFPADHKFYATEIMATMVEVKFYLQTLSMEVAPEMVNDRLRDASIPILGHPMGVGEFLDPIAKQPVKFEAFVEDRRAVESGHIIPLGRSYKGIRGRHNLENATLMLRDSNRIQADKTIPELMEMLVGILNRHGYTVIAPQEIA